MIKDIKLPLTFNHQFHSNEVKDPKRIYLLLHGYLLDGEFIFNKLKTLFTTDTLVIAPNGPFMVPQKNKQNEYIPKYAWYFFDPLKKTFYINYEPAAKFLSELLYKINSKKLPVTIIGYSQGGYLAPKVAELSPQVDQVIGLACVYRNAKFELNPHTTYHQINCQDDPIIEIKGAKDEWNALKKRGNQGKFIQINSIGHRLNQGYIQALSDSNLL